MEFFLNRGYVRGTLSLVGLSPRRAKFCDFATTANPVSAPRSILVGCFGDVAWIRVEGAGSHQNSDRLREFAKRRIAEGTTAFVLDLANCPTMDSTFMGTLASLALALKRRGIDSGGIDILNANHRNQQSLTKLGLQHLMTIDETGASWRSERELVADNLSRPLAPTDLGRQERIEMVLEAHEALVKANEENRSRFRDVLEYLHRDLESNSA